MKQISLKLRDVPHAQPIVFKLRGASPKDSFLLREVVGLTPPQKNLFINDLARDGSIYQGRRVGTRNVVLTFDLNPDPSLGETISSLRERTQKLVMGSNNHYGVESPIEVVLEYENQPDRYISGRLETFESGLFTEESLVQLSIICPDPYIYGSEVQVQKEPGHITLPLSYTGTSETGFSTTINIETHGTTRLTLAVDEQTMEFNFGNPVPKGSFAHINTRPGERTATMIEPSTAWNLLPTLNPRSKWLTIGPLTSTISVFGSNPGNFVASITDLRYTPSYWGV